MARLNTHRLRALNRKMLDEQNASMLRKSLRIFREALIRKGYEMAEIDRLLHELEGRLREREQ